jgi:site-specific DNA-methyltransferase (adenine-specific)
VPDGFAAEGDTWYFPAGLRDVQRACRLARLPEIVRACSNPGDVVLGPFGGSGTTLVVAKRLHRRYLGFELSPDYAAAIRQRLDATHPGQSLSGSPEPTAGGKGRGSRARSR